eukprot:622831-Prymnesium_polylepis.1
MSLTCAACRRWWGLPPRPTHSSQPARWHRAAACPSAHAPARASSSSKSPRAPAPLGSRRLTGA